MLILLIWFVAYELDLHSFQTEKDINGPVSGFVGGIPLPTFDSRI